MLRRYGDDNPKTAARSVRNRLDAIAHRSAENPPIEQTPLGRSVDNAFNKLVTTRPYRPTRRRRVIHEVIVTLTLATTLMTAVLGGAWAAMGFNAIAELTMLYIVVAWCWAAWLIEYLVALHAGHIRQLSHYDPPVSQTYDPDWDQAPEPIEDNPPAPEPIRTDGPPPRCADELANPLLRIALRRRGKDVGDPWEPMPPTEPDGWVEDMRRVFFSESVTFTSEPTTFGFVARHLIATALVCLLSAVVVFSASHGRIEEWVSVLAMLLFAAFGILCVSGIACYVLALRVRRRPAFNLKQSRQESPVE